jgi:hypothetical protein
MSSDDSDEDATHGLVFRPRRLSWRRRDVDELVDLMDDYRRRQTVGHSVRGARPQKRLRDPLHQQESSRDVPMSLPNELYEPTWLEVMNAAYQDLILTAENPTNFRWQMPGLT